MRQEGKDGSWTDGMAEISPISQKRDGKKIQSVHYRKSMENVASFLKDIQRPAKRFVNLAKQDPGRARQNS